MCTEFKVPILGFKISAHFEGTLLSGKANKQEVAKVVPVSEKCGKIWRCTETSTHIFGIVIIFIKFTYNSELNNLRKIV